jgi:hypothetical protein
MPTQLSKLALVNPSVDGSGDFDALSETKSFSVVQEGAAEASRQVISIEPNTQVIENNREIITSKNYNITVTGVYSDSTKTQLYTWASAQTNLVFTGYGLDGSILQMEGTLQINKGFEDNMSYRFSSMREAKGGYNTSDGKHSAEMSYCKNGLALYGWQEGSTSGVAAGWTNGFGDPANSFETVGFSGGIQRVAESTNNDRALYRDIHFPFAGQTLTFSIDVVETSDPANNDYTGALIGIQCYNASNGTVNSQETQARSATGTVQVSKTLPSTCKWVRISVEGDSGCDFEFQNPTLQLSTDYGFVEFNT